MKITSIAALTMAALAPAAMAQMSALKGSDTLAGVMTDAIIAAGMEDRIVYNGGGSGLGETALVHREQGIAPMSRPFKDAALAEARGQGIEPVPHVIALDGIGIFVNQANTTPKLTVAQIRAIYECRTTRWEQIPGSGVTGVMKVVRRNDASGTTDTFKHITGLTAFGSCVEVLAETADIAQATATNRLAVGYSGMTARRDANHAVAVSATDNGPAILPTVATIRNKTYPFARDLFVYEATRNLRPNAAERELLDHLLDRSFIDPIVQDNDFYTLD